MSTPPESTRPTATPVPIETPLDQRLVPLLGTELVAALTSTRDIYIALPSICGVLGLDPDGQVQRIRRHEVLTEGLRRIPLDTPGGRQVTYCVRVDLIGLWLAGTSTKRLQADIRALIVKYQQQLAPVATRLFLQVVTDSTTPALAPPSDPRLTELTRQHQDLLDVAQLLQEHIDAVRATTGAIADVGVRLTSVTEILEAVISRQHLLGTRLETTDTRIDQIDARTQQLSPAHKRQVRDQVEHMVRATQTLPSALTYGRIYGRLKYRFQVASYGEIADEAFESVMTYLRELLRAATSGQGPEQEPLF